MRVFMDTFSGDAAELRGKHRTQENVLAALRRCPRVSVWDMTEHTWLVRHIKALEKSGEIIRRTGDRYPWLEYTFPAERMEKADG